LELLASNPGANKRDLASLLGLKGSDRIRLKRVLKELEQEGTVEGSKKRGLIRRGELPDMAVIEVAGIDADGELLARPLQWEFNEAPPLIYVVPPKEGAAPATGARLLAKLAKHGDHYEARIVRKLENEAPSRILGVLREHPKGFRLEPVDKKARTEYALEKADLSGGKNNELVAAEPVPGRIAGFSRVRVVERIGSMDSPRTISLIAIHDHGIPTEFPATVLVHAKAAQPADPRGRTDLRDIPLVTIDPADARDHDDAVWAGPDEDPKNPGGHVCLVAIADVAHYVTPGSALDREALKRGNSAYFPDRVVPMLPEELSADLCSLKEGLDRACLAVRMVFDSKGKKRGHTFLRGIMRSAARLTYQQAQAAFDGRPDAAMSDTVKQTLAQLWTAYKVLTIEREHRDPLDLDLPERRIVLGADGHVASIAYRDRLESMKLIEEFMVLANVCAAESLEEKRTPLIYRVHDTPSKEKLYAFSDFLKTLNLSFAKGQVVKPGTFNRVLDQGRGKPHEAALNDVVLRSQAQAIYDNANIGHFGLNLAKYAHFTSPIRRYADLIVHRALIRAFKFGSDALTDAEVGKLKQIAEHITVTERRAMAAERDSTDRYVAAYMADRVGAQFTARVSGVTRFGLFVRLAETGADGLIPIRSLGAEFFRHDEKAQALIGERSRHAYRMGDKLEVTLEEAAPVTGGLRFSLAAPVGAASARGRFGHARGAKPGKKPGFRPKRR
ncbi:MAG: ribonuclease R, partial [Alphaproteobacteria bacterium]|nr:ribonuclease R [Alphaproteobacteria bacterium]